MRPGVLLSEVVQKYGIDADEFPEFVFTPFGQRIRLREDDMWKARLSVEHVGCSPVVFHWGKTFCAHPLVEWAFRTWSIERIQSRIDLRPCLLVGRALAELYAKPIRSTQRLEQDVANWAINTATSAMAMKQPQLQIGVRIFIGWAVDEDLPGFTEYALNRVLEISLPRHGAEHLVSILDLEGGPFTYTELRAIEKALDQNEGLVAERAIYFLGRDWGLRPVQIALLRKEDVGQDAVGPFVMVPSVKGIRRSALRRHPSNFKKRYISSETYLALNEAIVRASNRAAQLRAQLVEWSICTADTADSLPLPLFPAQKTRRRYQIMAGDKAIAEFMLHADSQLISRWLRGLSRILKVPRPAIAQGMLSEDVLEIGLLRLRRTKGTSMVLNGASPEEVAEALDHETTQTVSHYFAINRDVIEYIDVVQSANVDVRAAADAWAGRLLAKRDAHDGVKVGSLGICTLGKPCPHHPTVSCYSCQKFEPYLDGDHKLARESIFELKNMIGETSTGPVLKQIDAAIQGADAIILAIAGHQHGS